MKVAFAVLAIFGLINLLLAWWAEVSGKSPDEKAGSAFFALLAIAAFALDALLLIGWAAWKLYTL